MIKYGTHPDFEKFFYENDVIPPVSPNHIQVYSLHKSSKLSFIYLDEFTRKYIRTIFCSWTYNYDIVRRAGEWPCLIDRRENAHYERCVIAHCINYLESSLHLHTDERVGSVEYVMNRMSLFMTLVRLGVIKEHELVGPAYEWHIFRSTVLAMAVRDKDDDTFVFVPNAENGFTTFAQWAS